MEMATVSDKEGLLLAPSDRAAHAALLMSRLSAAPLPERRGVKARLIAVTEDVRFKKTLRYILKLITFIMYTAGGAMVFQLLEQKVTQEFANDQRTNLLNAREQLELSVIAAICNESMLLHVKQLLVSYEAALTSAADIGLAIYQVNETNTVATHWDDPWTYEQSVFFAATVLTTIGYGNVAPATVWGKVFCIAFALLGIPLSLSFIASTGEVLASMASMLPTKRIIDMIPKGKPRTILAAMSTVILLLGFIAVGGLMFHLLEFWPFLDAFYFCFITTTTIGFGDFVPSPQSLLWCTGYIMVGLALTSMVIELVGRQYSKSWAKMQELSNKLHNLSSPLAMAIRKMAINGVCQFDMDPELLRELHHLSNELAVIRNKPPTDLSDLLSSVPTKRITILMYESAV